MLYLKYEVSQNLNEGIEDVSKAKKAKAKEIKAITMQFLQHEQEQRRNCNIPVYISYAMALNKLEGYKSAKKVFDLAFTTTAAATNQKKAYCTTDDLLLYVHATKLELKQGQCDNALWILALMAHKRTFEPCNLNKLDLLAYAYTAREKIEEALNKASADIQVEYKTRPILPKNHYLALVFGLAWLNYLLDGKLISESPSDLPTAEVCLQLQSDVLKFAGNRQKDLKSAILDWISQFPRSANALKSLEGLNVQTAISSAFWRSLSASLTSKSSISPIGHLAIVGLLIQQFKQSDNLQNGHLFKAWTLLTDYVKSEPCRTCLQAWRLLMWTTHMLSNRNNLDK